MAKLSHCAIGQFSRILFHFGDTSLNKYTARPVRGSCAAASASGVLILPILLCATTCFGSALLSPTASILGRSKRTLCAFALGQIEHRLTFNHPSHTTPNPGTLSAGKKNPNRLSGSRNVEHMRYQRAYRRTNKATRLAALEPDMSKLTP